MGKVNRDRTKQVVEEIESWRRLLEFLQVENSHLKSRIAQIVSNDISSQILAMSEEFESRFINMDEMIRVAKKNIHDLNSSVTMFSFKESVLTPGISAKLKNLRAEMEALEHRFNKLKFSFQHFISENF
jgi:hypothetical protein